MATRPKLSDEERWEREKFATLIGRIRRLSLR
jgi:hypothetical protein